MAGMLLNLTKVCQILGLHWSNEVLYVPIVCRVYQDLGREAFF